MPRDLAKSLCDLCREADVTMLWIETAIGADRCEVVALWLKDGIIHFTATGELPKVLL